MSLDECVRTNEASFISFGSQACALDPLKKYAVESFQISFDEEK
jgi:hypothetical protein